MPFRFASSLLVRATEQGRPTAAWVFRITTSTVAAYIAAKAMHPGSDGITGALICRDGLFVQLLEGRRDVVTAAFSRILHDDRRLFPGWSMATILGAVDVDAGRRRSK